MGDKMSFYPINLDLSDKECAVIGGGKVAWRKVVSLLKAGAKVTVISPELIEPLFYMAEKEQIVHKKKCYRQGDLTGFFIVICATNQQMVNRQAAEDAKKNGALINVVDKSYPNDFIVPAQVCRGNLLITVSTGGQSPAFSRQLQRELSNKYGDEYAVYLDLIADMRETLKDVLQDSEARVKFWQQAMNQEILDLIKQGKLSKAEAEIKNAIGSIRTKS